MTSGVGKITACLFPRNFRSPTYRCGSPSGVRTSVLLRLDARHGGRGHDQSNPLTMPVRAHRGAGRQAEGRDMDFEKFTDRARGFVQSAQSLALREGHQQFTPEHLLKVLLDDPEGLAAGLIDRSGGRSREALAP